MDYSVSKTNGGRQTNRLQTAPAALLASVRSLRSLPKGQKLLWR